MSRRRGGWLVGALLLGALAACPRPAPAPPRLAQLEAAQLLEQLHRGGLQHRQAVGLVALEYTAVDGFFRGQADVAACRPAQLRIELRSFFGQPAGALASDGQQFVFVDNLAQRVVQGATDAPALQQLLPLGLPLEATVSLLLGALPPLPPGRTGYIAPTEGAALALEHRTADGVWLLNLGEQGAPLRAARHLDSHGTQRYAVHFTAHRVLAGLRFPTAGEVEVAGRAGSVRWRWEEVELNGEPLPEEAWQLQIPPGYPSP